MPPGCPAARVCCSELFESSALSDEEFGTVLERRRSMFPGRGFRTALKVHLRHLPGLPSRLPGVLIRGSISTPLRHPFHHRKFCARDQVGEPSLAGASCSEVNTGVSLFFRHQLAAVNHGRTERDPRRNRNNIVVVKWNRMHFDMHGQCRT
jgi:hypothetical protein